MAKRMREQDEGEPSKVETEDRAAKRHFALPGSGSPENPRRGQPLGWDLLASGPVGAKHSIAALPPSHPPSVALRPANQAAGLEGPYSLANQHDQHSPPHGSTAEAEQQQQYAAAELAALQCSANIDWQKPEQVAQLLRMLHLERLRRQGLQLPPEYQHYSQQQQYAQQQQQQQHGQPRQ